MIYLDNNATTRVAEEVFDAMKPFLDASFGNASSSYSLGRESRQVVESAREDVAALLGADSAGEIVFTSCGSESDNWAILGTVRADPKLRRIITTRVEHEAVRKPVEMLEHQGCPVTWLDVDGNGALDLEQLRRELVDETAFVSVMLANNETGILFPVGEVSRIVKERTNAIVHVDGVNAVGKVPINLKNTEIDLFSISAHKFYGPKGIGALYIRNGVDLSPNILGGGQEGGRRAGTEAVHQIAGLGAAAKLVSDMSPMEKVRKLRDRLEDEILERIPNSRINGTADREFRLPNTTSISFADANGEALLARLNDIGIFVSTGSACNAETHTASPVLAAMNIPYSQAAGTIRFSLGRYNTEGEIETVLAELPRIVEAVRSIA